MCRLEDLAHTVVNHHLQRMVPALHYNPNNLHKCHLEVDDYWSQLLSVEPDVEEWEHALDALLSRLVEIVNLASQEILLILLKD